MDLRVHREEHLGSGDFHKISWAVVQLQEAVVGVFLQFGLDYMNVSNY